MVTGALMLLILPAGTVRAEPPGPWGTLEPGPYAVGFETIEVFDYSRTFRHKLTSRDLPGDHERARPVPIALWYPAETDPGALSMMYAEYAFPIPDDTVSSRRATTIQWTWSKELAANQGFEVRVWHASDSSPMGVAPPTTEKQLEMNFHLTPAYKQHGEGFYYLDVIVVQIEPYKILSHSFRIRVKTDPSK